MSPQLFPRNSGAMLYPGMVRYEGIAAVLTLDKGEVIVLAPNFTALQVHCARMCSFEIERAKCKTAKIVQADVAITEPEPAMPVVGRDVYPDSPEAHEDAMIADEAADAMRNLPLVSMPPGRDCIPPTHPRRIAQLSALSDRDIQHEPEEVRRLVGYHRDNQLFPTCEAVGHCPKPTADAAPFHHFYWDGERDTERMEKIHNGGRGHDDPLSNYGAVECKTCGRKALVLSDADDFPQI